MMNLEGKLSRREAIAESAKTIAAAFVLPKLKPLEIFVQQKDKAVEVYKAAELSASKRTEWVNLRFPKSELPPYILSIDYATPELLRQPIFRNGPIPYPGAYTKTVFYRQGDHARGAKGRVLVFDGPFTTLIKNFTRYSQSPDFYRDMEFIASNHILKNIFVVNGRIFEGSVAGYPVERFRFPDGVPNNRLYQDILIMYGNKSEFDTLKQEDSKRRGGSQILRKHMETLFTNASKNYSILLNNPLIRGMDTSLIQSLRRDFEPSKLYGTLPR